MLLLYQIINFDTIAIMKKQRIVVGISGRGSTMQAVYNATQDGRLANSEIVGVFSTNPDALGLQIAKKFKTLNPQTDLIVLDHKDSDYGSKIIELLDRTRATILCQFGLSSLTPTSVLDWMELHHIAGINQHGGT